MHLSLYKLCYYCYKKEMVEFIDLFHAMGRLSLFKPPKFMMLLFSLVREKLRF